MGFGGDARHPVARREAALAALSNPDKQIMLLNNAGAGDFSAPPRQILKKMREDGSYIPEAKWIHDMIGDELDKYGGNIEIWGHSMGARLAVGLAAARFAAKGEQVSGLTLIDPPGSKNNGLLGMTVGFLVKEGAKTAGYSKSPYNETSQLEERVGQPKIKRSFVEKLVALKRLFIDQPIVMGKQGLEQDLEAALPGIRDKLTIISPEKSSLTKSEKVKSMLGRLAAKTIRPETIQQVILPEHSHSIISAGSGARPANTVYGLANETERASDGRTIKI